MDIRNGLGLENSDLGDQSGRSETNADSAESNRAEMFLALHLQNHNRLAAFVHTLVPAWQDAEEIIQDTLMVLWRKFDEFDPSTSFFSWAARVAQYEVLNYRRKNRQVGDPCLPTAEAERPYQGRPEALPGRQNRIRPRRDPGPPGPEATEGYPCKPSFRLSG